MNIPTVFLTQSTSFITGPLARLFGWIMNGIYNFFISLNIESIGVSIIIFTIIIRALMIPLAIKQQKSMKDIQKIQPEIKKIQDKYKDKKDPESQKKMQAETAKLYQEHNVNPLSGCLPLIIQMPIFIALFAVLRHMPAYIMRIKDVYIEIVAKITGVTGYEDILQSFMTNAKKAQVKNFDPTIQDKIVDLLSTFSSVEWVDFKSKFAVVGDQLTLLIDKIKDMNYFFGINLADNPIDFSNGLAGIFTVGALIPVLCFLAQLLITKTTPTNSSGNKSQDQSQKTMMYIMPVISLIFTIQMPAGLGLYWLTGNVFQFFQQFFMNKYFNKEKEK